MAPGRRCCRPASEITDIEPVGHYAVQPSFNDGHNTGLYTWEMLYDLGVNQEACWQDYLARVSAAGVERDAPMLQAAGSACASH
jgi:DUF971 family protein